MMDSRQLGSGDFMRNQKNKIWTLEVQLERHASGKVVDRRSDFWIC